ncbi:MAG TPA: hypothetical protein VHN98_07280 [Acidimicrobiales bacterium]|nr:hypothetical protein [Acidimicrobiales bacterium]
MRLLSAGGVLLLVAVALGALGVAGYRGGPAIAAAALATTGATAAVVARRRRGDGHRLAWAVAFAVAGVVLAGALVDRAPASKARLAQRMDRLVLPFFVQTAEVRTGHSWCRPSCPAVTRTYRSPDTADRATLLVVATALYHEGAITDVRTLQQIGNQPGFQIRDRHLSVTVTVDSRRAGSRTVKVRYASRQ